jgi:DeoR family fructose operon transcriptional repressor
MRQISLNQRQQDILDRLIVKREMKLSELKEMYDVTEMTLRRDLEKLELTGTVKRIFGGAILISKDIALKNRTDVLTEEKIRIGQKAAAYITSGDSIFIDGGSTTLQIARSLKPEMNITVVTNALNIAAELQDKQIYVIVTGGVLLEDTSTLVGPIAVDLISKMAFDRAFLGTTGLTVNHGFSNSNMYEAEIKRLASQQAAETNIVMDHTKYGLQALFSFAQWSRVNRLISNELPEQELLDEALEASVEIIRS